MAAEKTNDNVQVKSQNIVKKTLQATVSVKPDIPVLTADDVKIMTDAGSRLCTLMFFQRHPVPRVGDYGLELDSIHMEAFLEVKLPLETALEIGLYMYSKLQGYAQGEDIHGIDFGPSGMHMETAPTDAGKKE